MPIATTLRESSTDNPAEASNESAMTQRRGGEGGSYDD
jgi:hypothetical protein